MYQTPGITKKQTRLLGLCAAVALLAVGATAATGRAAPTPYYQVQLEAAGGCRLAWTQSRAIKRSGTSP